VHPAARLAASAALLACLSFPALAGDACDGAVQATGLQPLPNPLTVAFHNPRNTAQASRVGAAFVDGLRAGGVTVQPKGTVVLRLTFLITTADGHSQHEYTDFSWTRAPGAANGPPPTITVTAGLSNPGQATLLWVASLECKIKTQDPTVLAQALGQVIGQVLGQHLDQKSF
jgi:hypothetical protein